MLSGLSPLSPFSFSFSLSFSFPPSSVPPSILEPFEAPLRLLGAGGRKSFEIVILPVSILHKTSHQLGRSANAGLQTPAIYPGLYTAIQFPRSATRSGFRLGEGERERVFVNLTHSRDCPSYSNSCKGMYVPRTHPTPLHNRSRVHRQRELDLLLSLPLDRVLGKRLDEK